MDPFADLFTFDADWGFLFAIIALALTVQWVEGRNPDLAWTYAGILLLGLLVIPNGRFPNFTSELGRIVGR